MNIKEHQAMMRRIKAELDAQEKQKKLKKTKNKKEEK